jgi:cytochrome c oxidase accessory protein FixG
MNLRSLELDSQARFPRSEPKASGEPHKTGDCVDCGLCVAVCPTGIDIRKGLQLECIACTQCIDACNGVMARVGRAPDLIAYRSLAALEGRRTRLLRPRVVIYASLLALACAGFTATLARRAPFSIEVERNRSALYTPMPDGRIGNAYTLHLQNRDRREHVYRIRIEAPPGYQLVAGVNPVRIPATDALTASVFVTVPAEQAGATPIRFVFEDLERLERKLVRDTTFLAPARADAGAARSGGGPHAG